jgi:cation diffusion facilitator CzcD-associated flavoprotein CzcO
MSSTDFSVACCFIRQKHSETLPLACTTNTYHSIRWSQRYCKRDEILLYLETVASHFEVRRRILFGRKVVSCAWDADSALWTVTTAQGDKHVANFVVVASGLLHVPRWPQVKGNAQ